MPPDRNGGKLKVEEKFLVIRLSNCVGIQGTALNWFKSYLSDRTFSVEIGNFSSSSVPLTWCTSGVHFGPAVVFAVFAPFRLDFSITQYSISLSCG